MPAGLLGLLAMPFGLDGVFWWLMGIGIDWMIAVTRWVAALPGAVGRMAAFGTGPMIAASVGIILMGLLRTPLRWSGALMLGLSLVWALVVPQPDVLISGDGRSVAVRGRDGELHLMQSGKDVFLVKEWLAADADARVPGDATLAKGVSCDDEGCVAALADGALVTHATSPEALADDCDRAVLIVSARHAPQDCAAAVIDRDRLRRQGALALRRKADGFDVEAVKPRGFDRPWAPAAADVAADAATLSRPQAAKGKDATPAESDLQPDD
jgi:competence protein ComEC